MGLERVLIDLGDHEGRPLKDRVSFFQVSLDKSRAQVTIDLAQVQRSAILAKDLIKSFKASPLVKSVTLNFDPEDLSTNLVLKLKRAVRMEVFEMPSKLKASRIAIDLQAL